MSAADEKAWKDYLALLAPYRDDPDAYERLEPYAWANLQEALAKQELVKVA